MGLKKGTPAMEQEEGEQKRAVILMNLSLLEDLIKRSQEGDTVAMEAIYERYKQPIFNLIYRYTYNVTVAEDLLQDIFLKIFTHLKDVQKVESFVGWLYRIAINTCYSYLRSIKGKLQKTIPLEDVERKIDNDASDTPDSVLKKPLDEAIQHLPPKLKSVFLLHEVQGYKHHEIARLLGCSVGTSKSQLFKARMKLRQFLKNKQLV
jgi:RNA polymerase sigma-70 factor (ECF subfamily)